MTLIVGGCGLSGNPGTDRLSPEVPPWLAPVDVPDVAPKADARAVAGACYVSLRQANGRLRDGRSWSEQLKQELAK